MKTASDFIRDDIKSMSAYRIADLSEGFIKLDAMESPYHPFARFPELSNEWLRLIAQAQIHLYPNPAASGLQETLRKAFDIPESAAIALGNGSDELIQFMTLLVAQSGATMLAVEPSFVMYRHNAELYGMNYVGVPLNEDFTLDLPAVLSAIDKHQPALIFIAYPNNPTGVCFRREEVEAIIRAARGIVVVDEAYGAFSRDSFLPQAEHRKSGRDAHHQQNRFCRTAHRLCGRKPRRNGRAGENPAALQYEPIKLGDRQIRPATPRRDSDDHRYFESRTRTRFQRIVRHRSSESLPQRSEFHYRTRSRCRRIV